MQLAEAVSIAAAGFAAGAINTVVGSGTLVTFPVLLAFGYAPVSANVSNTVGLVPGSLSGALGYRRELSGQRSTALRLGLASGLGGLGGAILLLVLPAAAFKAIVPAFIAAAVVLVILQERIVLALALHTARRRRAASALSMLALFAAGLYGGYFGAAQGVLLLAILGIALAEGLQRTNALKNVLGGIVNGVAAILFMAVANVQWGPAALIAAGSVVGAQVGARYGRRLPPRVLRALIVIVGIAAIIQLLGA